MYTDLILLLEEFLNATFPEVADGWTKVEKLREDTKKNPPLLFSLGFSPSGWSHFHTILFKVSIEVIPLLMTQPLPKKGKDTWMTLVPFSELILETVSSMVI